MAGIRGDEPSVFFEVTGLPKDTFVVVSFSGTEAISTPFEYDLSLASPDHDLDFQSVLGKKAQLVIKGDDGDRHVHGIVRRIEHVGMSERLARYQVSLVPELWKLGLGRNMRIFQKMTIPDIVKKVLRDGGVPDNDVKVTVHDPHEVWTYCVQYRESDLAFASRLLEQEGIFYFFEHSGSQTLLHAGDQPSDHPACPDVGELPYRPSAGMAESEEVVLSFTFAEGIRPDAYSLRDYFFETSTVDLTGTEKDKPGLDTEVFDFPGEFELEKEAKQSTKLGLEAARAERRRGVGSTSCTRLIPGHTFTMKGHPRKEFNTKYLVVQVDHHATQPQVLKEEAGGGESSYSCTFTCIPAEVPYRPPRVTPKPLAQGAQTAVVVGPSSEEIHTDEDGHARICVQFHWDREGKRDEHSSCWIRVAQTMAGAGWGTLFLPRIGHEVIVEFIDGDPDHPVITGCLYNDVNQPPYALPSSKTKSTIKTNSSKGGGGYNELRFEDLKDHEEIFLHGQKDWNVVIENDESDTIAANRSVDVGKNERVTIGENRTEDVGKNETITIGENRNETVEGEEKISIRKDRTEEVGQSSRLGVQKDLTEEVGDNRTAEVGKNMAVHVGKKFTLVADDQITLKSGGAQLVMKKNGNVQISASKVQVKASGVISLKGSKVTEN